ncbi:MAG: hypothetical protein KY475_11810 [Planctomycetes bacterium]|nr:hypothetical protein [Planctomycetota bacterium]
MKLRHAGALGALVIAGVVVGCQDRKRMTVGGDTPVTTERLEGAQVSRGGVAWTFDRSMVVIEGEDGPLPAGLAEAIVGDASPPIRRVEAAWRLDQQAGVLHLAISSVDGEALERETALPIRPAGHVRIDIGSRQYNIIPRAAQSP